MRGRPEGFLAVHWGLLGVSWGSLGWPLRVLEGLLAVLGVPRKSFGMSWGRFWGVRAAKRYQHDAKMDIQSSTALKKARFPLYECTGLCRGLFLLLFAILSRVPLKIRAHLSGRVSKGVFGAF